ncbi:putative MFS-type transporter EfpA [Baekduia alba]|uniref:MFS transporter n=1 Tax=Baekduia alba TaxID=2997333 RepID=UPI0023423B0A|nr:MFS transporter [Baekduia alba]WCB91556.1 putative MFS-type transporter EfpA [Baekduia alba]
MTSQSSHVNRWRAFALLAVAFFMTVVDLTIVNVSLPTIGADLHFSETNLQWVVTAYALTFGGFLLLGGRAADLLGRRRILMVGLALFGAASLAAGLATAAGFMIGARAVQGLGAAIMLPAALSIVMNMFQEGAERNKALGIWGGLGAGGATVGVIAGGLLTRYAGWEYIFYLNVPISVVALLLAPRIVPESRLDTVRRKFDAAGALTGTAGLVLLVDAISQAPQYGWGDARTIGVLAAAALLLAAFLLIERRVTDPILPLQIFRLRTLAGANIAGLLLGGSFYAFIFVGTLYMQQVLHYSALQSGLAWLAASLTSIALAGLSQALVTRGATKIVMAAGMAMIGAGAIWAAQAPVDGDFLADLAGPMVVSGAGTAFAFIPISIAALAGIKEHQAGLASGLLNTSQQLGGALGIAIASSVATSHTQTLLHTGHAAPAALTGGFQQALWVLGGIALLAIPAIFALVRHEAVPTAVAETSDRDPQPALACTN